MASLDPLTLHQGELDLLITDLVAAGFLPVGGDRHDWSGPISSSLQRLTSAKVMRIEIRDGWPYRHPYIHVEGLTGRKHVNALGNACLWFEDDGNWGQWLRLQTILSRVDAWVSDQEAGVSEPALDAHLYLSTPSAGLLTVDIQSLLDGGALQATPGSRRILRAQQVGNVFAIGERGQLEAACLWIDSPSAPPSDLTQVRRDLTRAQRRIYDRVTGGASRSRPSVLLLLWRDSGTVNALGLKVERASPGRYRLLTLEVARTDAAVMLLRSGPDAPRLNVTSVAMFGLGAIGSHVALLLVQSGIRRMTFVDGEILRPSNLSRHAASGRYVGSSKADAMDRTLRDGFLDLKVKTVRGFLWDPHDAALVAEGADLVVDATGNEAYGDMLSRIAATSRIPFVAATLHRAGRLSRVRAQVGDERPVWARTAEAGYPTIPAASAVEAPRWETGCGAPVINAPPVAVASAATLATRAIIDILSGRDHTERDLYEVYEPIEPPFDAQGPMSFGEVA